MTPRERLQAAADRLVEKSKDIEETIYDTSFNPDDKPALVRRDVERLRGIATEIEEIVK